MKEERIKQMRHCIQRNQKRRK